MQMEFRDFCRTLNKAIYSKDWKSANELVQSNIPELIENYVADRHHEVLKIYLLGPFVTQEKGYANVVINFFKLNDESINGQLKIALIKRDCEAVTTLLNKYKISDIEKDELSLVELVFGRWDIETRIKILEVLIKKGLNVHVKDRLRRNILLKFLRQFEIDKDFDFLDVVNLLLDSGVPLNETDPISSETSLHMAIWFGNVKFIKFLVEERNIDLNATCGARYSPLHKAVMSPKVDYDILDLLLSKGADVNAENVYGMSVLYMAKVRKNDPKLDDYLLKHGARDLESPLETEIDIICRYNAMQRQKFLKKHEEANV